MRTQTLFWKITPITPVHIGTGEVYEPFSFYIDEQSGELVHFDQSVFINMLAQRELEQLSAICKQGTPASIIELMRFVNSRGNGMLLDGERIPVSRDFVNHYHKTLKMDSRDNRKVKNELARFEIWRSAFDPYTSELYMPGSAIKGAIRTAVLNFKGRGVRGSIRGNEVSRILQEEILGFHWNDTYTDPFRLIKISDFIAIPQAPRRFIYYAVNRKKGNPRSARKLHQILEAVEAGVEFFGQISIVEQNRYVREPLNAKIIVEALHYFYGRENRRENRELETIGAKGIHLDMGIPLRIGRHSGAECVTVEGHRNIKGPGRQKYFKGQDHSTTLWLAGLSRNPRTNAGLRPFGWCVIESISEAQWREVRSRWLEFRENMARWREDNPSMPLRGSQVRAAVNGQEREQEPEEVAGEISPEEARRQRLEEFASSLPPAAKFPGEASKIVGQIEGMDDPALKQQAIELVTTRFKSQIKKGHKKGKKWALRLLELTEKG